MIRSLLLAALLISFGALTGCKESTGGGAVPKIKDKDGDKKFEVKSPQGGGDKAKAGPKPE